MAQPLFDEHPIELYLRESGEVPELMPGDLIEHSRQPTPIYDDVPYYLTTLQKWLSRLFDTIQPMFGYIAAGSWKSTLVSSEFAERFKYIVISSPLLSTSLSSSSTYRAATPTTPGHYDQCNSPSPATTPAFAPSVSATGSHISAFTLACLIPVVAARGYYLSCLLLLVAMKVLIDRSLSLSTSIKSRNGGEPWTMTLDCLKSLVTANTTWDNVVSDALGILEADEQSTFQPPSPSSSLPSLRVALSSALHTTQMQCDNVRQILAALTSPLVLSQLSNMYAPPSPTRMPASPNRPRPMSLVPPSPVPSHFISHMRPLSLSNPLGDPYIRARAGSASQMSLHDKRSTWNGSYMPLPRGSSTRQLRRRPNLSAIIRPEDMKSPITPTFSDPGSSSHVLTPPMTPPAPVEDAAGDADAEDEPFGVAALDLHRRRRIKRFSMFNTPSQPSNITRLPEAGSSSQIPASHAPPLTSSFGSNFTSMSTIFPSSRSAQPLSLSNLHLAVQGALGSKRFACAHLLALRFSDSNFAAKDRSDSDIGSDMEYEDDVYWEDVRSVISLLTSTLEDASARLADSLADAVRRQERESELLSDEEPYSHSASHERPASSNGPPPSLSFAPMPSHLARFAAHVDAITSALDEARDQLRQCVASLKEDARVASQSSGDPVSPPVALQSYERLRRELGLALRECERGRGALLDIAQQERSASMQQPGEDDGEVLLRQEEQLSSGESDKTLCNSNEVHEPKFIHVVDQDQDRDPPPLGLHDDDDATLHLIQTASSQHLPPPGIEQVFESMSMAQPFVRERSKLPREERIRLAKARRESQSQFGLLGAASDDRDGELHLHPHPSRERDKWGPGGEVVQELKDVIWQVSERRRKMVEQSSSLLSPHSTSDALHLRP